MKLYIFSRIYYTSHSTNSLLIPCVLIYILFFFCVLYISWPFINCNYFIFRQEELVVLAHVLPGVPAADVSAIPPFLSAQVASAAGHVTSDFLQAAS